MIVRLVVTMLGAAALAGAIMLVRGAAPDRVADRASDRAATATAGAPALPQVSGTPGAPSPAGPAGPARVGPVAPLSRAVPPDILLIVPTGLRPDQVAAIRTMPKVRDVVVADGGTVRIQGRRAGVLGVDPSAFRAWTPPDLAAADRLWASVAAGDFVASTSLRRYLGLRDGTPYVITARSSPLVSLAGTAGIGLPGVDLLVNQRVSAELGLVTGVAALVNAPGGDLPGLTAGLRAALGDQAQVINLHESGTELPTGGDVPPGRARSYLDLYRQAATRCPGLSWTVLAAIGQIESAHGRNNGPSSAGALGPMQFMPATWAAYGVDGDGDGKRDTMNPYDAVPAAAEYLCANGGGEGGRRLETALWHYNHSDAYVRQVLALARAYARQYG